MERLFQEYGPVVTLRSGVRPIITIGRHHEALELMEKEGASLGDRPPWVAASEMVSGGMRILLINAGKRFRKLRRYLHIRLGAETPLTVARPKSATQSPAGQSSRQLRVSADTRCPQLGFGYYARS